MAAANSVGWVTPNNLTQTTTATTISKAQLGMSDETKRWVIVGVAFNTVLVPALKKHVDHEMAFFYKNLVKNHKINQQNCNQNYLQYDPGKKTSLFNYRSLKKKPHIVKIMSHDELAKLYLEPHMVKFKQISDDNFEGSAVLNILGKASCFTNNEDLAANKVRTKVRNEWAHCQIHTWDVVKFLDSFQLMEDLAETLPNAAHVSKDDVVAEIKQWREDGLKLLGNNVDKKLLDKTILQAEKIIATITACGDNFSTNAKEIISNMKLMKTNVDRLEQRQNKVEEEQLLMKNVQKDHTNRITSLEQPPVHITSPFYDIPNRNVFFTGRSSITSQIQEAMQSQSEEPFIATISGLGGVGKTSVAVELCWKMKAHFPGGVYWLTADSGDQENGIRQSLLSLARRIDQVDAEIDDRRLVDLVTSHLLKQDRALLVVDNLDYEEFECSPIVSKVVNGSWVNSSKINILITSRLRQDQLQEKLSLSAHSITLESYNLEEGVEFLRRRTEMEFDEIDGKDLALTLGCLPLALEQAAAYIKMSKCPFPAYIKRLNQEKLKILGKQKAKPPTEHIEPSRLAVKTTWNINMSCIKDKCPAAHEIMMVLSFLSPRCIPMSIINAGIPELDDKDLANSLEDDFDKKDMILTLTKLSLFDSSSDDDVRVHRMVQDVIKEDIKNRGTIKPTLTNALRMLMGALEKEKSPYTFMDSKENKISNSSTLCPWSKILDNVGHFLDEVKHIKMLDDSIFVNSEFITILQNAALYYFVKNQTDRSAFYRELSIKILPKVTLNPKYKPMMEHTLPLSISDKEMLYNLIEPSSKFTLDKMTKEQRKSTSETLKEEGNTYFKEQNYEEAIRSFMRCLEIVDDQELIQKVHLNICQSFYRLKEYSQVKKYALKILDKDPQNSKAYLWLALQYEKSYVYDLYGTNQNKSLEYDSSGGVSEYKEFSEVEEVVGELAYLYGALAHHFSEDKEKTNIMLERNGIRLWRTKVITVSNSDELQLALDKSTLERQKRGMSLNGERHVILLKQGYYHLNPTRFSECLKTLLYGEMIENSSMRSKIILIQNESEHPHLITASNIFVNISFDLRQYPIHLHILDDHPSLFYNCHFEGTNHSTKKYNLRKTMEALEETLKSRSGVQQELFEMDPKYKQTIAKLGELDPTSYGARPVLILSSGNCAIIDCEITYSKGGGLLSDGLSKGLIRSPFSPDEFISICNVPRKPPVLVVLGSTIGNCGMGGLEVREGGSLISINNNIHSNKKGIFVWHEPAKVHISNCHVFNNYNEGIHVTEDSYANSVEVLIAGNSIHHNTLGISTDKMKCIKIKDNEIFNNNSWGMFLRNSQIAIIEGNNIHRNNCGGIRCTLNRFHNTLVKDNVIHDHTGPYIIQTTLMDEIEHQMFPLLSREGNNFKIFILDNFIYNNELSYGKVSDLIISVDNICNYCQNFGATAKCSRCGKVRYCDKECQKNEFSKHKFFCKHFKKTYINEIKLVPTVIHGHHPSIKVRTGIKSIKDLISSEFLVKIQAGPRNGLHMPVENINTVLTIYDESRTVNGMGHDKTLYMLVRQFGKLANDMVFCKRIYVYAKMIGRDPYHIQVRTDELVHDQDW